MNATDLSAHKASNTYTIVPFISITPEGLFQNDLVWITGRGFSGSSTITITWDGTQLITIPPVITTDVIGDFTASFRIPVNTFGNHRVVAVDQNGNIVSVQYLIASSVIDVSLDTGVLYFRGEVAEFSALTSQKGQPFNASTYSANLYLPNGTIRNLSAAVAQVGTGTYTIDYVIPGSATPGTYTLILNVIRDFNGARCFGSALKTFTVSATFDHMNATLIAINGTLGSLSLDTGPILVKLDEINATIASLNQSSNGEIIALLTTMAGNISSDLDMLNASLSSINNRIATISSYLGNIHTDVETIYAQITSVQGNMALIKSIVGYVNITLNTLNPILTGVNGSNLSFMTDLGAIQTNLDELQVRSIGIENKLVTIETNIGSIGAALENLTGITITIQTQNGPETVTFFTDMDLSKVEYKQADQAVLLSCTKTAESQGTLSLIMTKTTMDSLGSSPSLLKLFEGTQEIPFTVVEVPAAYVFQTTRSLGQHQLAFYLKGSPNIFLNPWLWIGGFSLLVVLGASLFLIRARKGKQQVRNVHTMTLERIEKFIDEKL